jgi:hypothetical protein
MKTLLGKKAKDFMKKINDNVTMLNGSKIFAGIMIIVLQISSRFVTIRLSKTMESYLKYTFSKQILIFAIAWMGTRDIYIALIIALIFSFISDVLCNEESNYCMLPNTFKDYHIQLAEDKEEENADITKSIPGMPPSNNASSMGTKKEGLTTKSQCDKTKVVTEDEIEKALEVLDNAKTQYTWNSLDEPFFK